MGTFKPPPRPDGLLLLLFKAPVFLYKFGLGRLMGDRFLLLTHEGRKSGKIRRTLLEVIRYDQGTGESLVISAYGERADWYRNIRAKPALQVCTRGRCFAPRQRFLSTEEAGEAFREYELAHGPYIRRLIKLTGSEYDGSEESRRELISFFRMVAFSPGN
jgi:deazaflavin-dependent oxidoreductase (nitroreductase family)